MVQDGGDTAINGTVLIYFQAFPNLCHHIRRGINPHGRAVTVLSDCTCTVDLTLHLVNSSSIPADSADNFIRDLDQHSFCPRRIISQAFGHGPSVLLILFSYHLILPTSVTTPPTTTDHSNFIHPTELNPIRIPRLEGYGVSVRVSGHGSIREWGH